MFGFGFKGRSGPWIVGLPRFLQLPIRCLAFPLFERILGPARLIFAATTSNVPLAYRARQIRRMDPLSVGDQLPRHQAGRDQGIQRFVALRPGRCRGARSLARRSGTYAQKYPFQVPGKIVAPLARSFSRARKSIRPPIHVAGASMAVISMFPPKKAEDLFAKLYFN